MAAASTTAAPPAAAVAGGRFADCDDVLVQAEWALLCHAASDAAPKSFWITVRDHTHTVTARSPATTLTLEPAGISLSVRLEDRGSAIAEVAAGSARAAVVAPFRALRRPDEREASGGAGSDLSAASEAAEESDMQRLTAVALTNDGATIAIGYADGSILLSSTAVGGTGESGAPTMHRCGVAGDAGTHVADVLRLMWFPSQRVLLSGGSDLTARVWDAADTRACVAALVGGHVGGVTGLAAVGRGRHVVTSGRDGALCMWDVSSQRVVGRVPLPGRAAVATTAAIHDLALGTRSPTAAVAAAAAPAPAASGLEGAVAVAAMRDGRAVAVDLAARSVVAMGELAPATAGAGAGSVGASAEAAAASHSVYADGGPQALCVCLVEGAAPSAGGVPQSYVLLGGSDGLLAIWSWAQLASATGAAPAHPEPLARLRLSRSGASVASIAALSPRPGGGAAKCVIGTSHGRVCVLELADAGSGLDCGIIGWLTGNEADSVAALDARAGLVAVASSRSRVALYNINGV